MTNLPNSTAQVACTLVVSDFHVFGGTNYSLMNENFSLVNEGNIFSEFLFFAFLIQFCENKNPAKISTYTVL